MNAKRPLVIVLTLLAAVLSGTALAGPALAHDRLKSSNPAKDAKVELVEKVTLEFTSTVRLPKVVVTDADGRTIPGDEPTVERTLVTQALSSPLPPGKYTIAYRVVSSDGHPIEDEIPFTVIPAKSAAPATESASPTPEQSSAPAASPTALTATAVAVTEESSSGGGIPVWLIIVIGGLAGIGIGFFMSTRSKRPKP
ncbi:copper resistance CopC family protein [Rhizohabitans arisaemae]|uniref:copper resistance CopC family protein n=1 Tax=Rhizohabitans arisaemae TaxID=2720610 RepID=UPI0024B1F518|nr:copper resistance CopC family protein [Rhizohabitans arisaemae]